jgi:hypothetical protein
MILSIHPSRRRSVHPSSPSIRQEDEEENEVTAVAAVTR